MLRIFANNVRAAVPTYDFAFITHDFNACSDFHKLVPLRGIISPGR